MTKARSLTNTSTTSTLSTSSTDSSESFIHKPPFPLPKSDHNDDLSHGTTVKARRPSGGKKNPGEGRSHVLAHIADGDQKNGSREEKKVERKKNKDLPTRVKKNHAPEQAAKVLGAMERE